MSNLILLTIQFPFGNSETFLESELLYLSNEFENIFIVPLTIDDKQREIPRNCKVIHFDQNFRPKNNANIKFMFPAMLAFLQLLLHPSNLKNIFYAIKHFKQHLIKGIFSHYYFRWIEVNKLHFYFNNTVIYSYWVDTPLISWIKFRSKNNLDFKIVCRAHRADLYKYVGVQSYRNFIFKFVDAIYFISSDGLKYAQNNWHIIPPKASVEYLGCLDHGKINSESQDSIFRIVSVAFLNKNKRIPEIALALQKVNPKFSIHWIHFGDGPDMNRLREISNQFKANVTFLPYGISSNKNILDYYENNPVDLFINFSESEGIPVSIMECMSFGIPVLCTDAGACSEIVSDLNGCLISVHTSIIELAQCIENFIEYDTTKRQSIRQEARSTFKRKFNADMNYTAFSRKLKSLLDYN